MVKVKSRTTPRSGTAIKKRKVIRSSRELDGVYVLKIVLYLIIGAQWIRLTDAELATQIPLPVGLLIGGLFAMHDHFRIDRKIEYAILLIASLVGFWSQTGLYFHIFD